MLDEPLLDGLLVISRPSRRMLLFGSLAVFFVQFLALGVPAPFLPTSPAGIAVGPHAVGVIFSSFPLGTVLVGPLVPRALEVFGARLVVSIGLVCSAVSALAFALVPTLLSGASPLTLTATFAACRLFGGASAAACETGTFTALCMSDWGERMGFVFAAIEVNVGLAISVGAAVGGWLYRAGEATPVGAFGLPFAVTACLQLLLLGLVAVSIPGRAARPAPTVATRGSAMPRVWTVGRVATLLSVVVWTACGEGLLPVLGPHLATVAGLNASQVGLTFALNSMIYMLASLPMGLLVDHASVLPHRKPLMAAGWAILTLGYLIIGPVASGFPERVMPLTLVAMAIIGVASSACIVPTMPELRVGLAEEAIPVVSASWTTSFSLGALIGPLVTSVACATAGFAITCALLALMCALASGGLLLATYSCRAPPVKSPLRSPPVIRGVPRIRSG